MTTVPERIYNVRSMATQKPILEIQRPQLYSKAGSRAREARLYNIKKSPLSDALLPARSHLVKFT